MFSRRPNKNPRKLTADDLKREAAEALAKYGPEPVLQFLPEEVAALQRRGPPSPTGGGGYQGMWRYLWQHLDRDTRCCTFTPVGFGRLRRYCSRGDRDDGGSQRIIRAICIPALIRFDAVHMLQEGPMPTPLQPNPPDPEPVEELPLTQHTSYLGIAPIDPRGCAAELELLHEYIALAGRSRKTFYLDLTMPMLQALYLLRGRNRKPTRDVVQRYMRMFLHQDWKESHQGFSVNWDGHMDDGLQRVIALMLALAQKPLPPVKMSVTFGVDPDAFMSMDSGKVRTAQQNLALTGVRHPAPIASAVRFLHACSSSTPSLSQSEVFEEVMRQHAEHPGMNENAVTYGVKLNKAINLPTASGVAGYIYLAKHGANATILNEFFAHMEQGTQADMFSPVRLARQKLIGIKRSRRDNDKNDPHSTLRRTQEIAYIIVAFNLYSRNRKAPARNWPYWTKTYALPAAEARDRYGGSMVHHRSKSDGSGATAP